MTESVRPPESALRVADHPFLRGLDPSLIESLAEHAVERDFEPGEFVVRDGEIADGCYLVFHGKIALEVSAPDRGRLTIQTVGPGEVLGWSWLTPPYRWQVDARALKHVRAVRLDAEVLRRTFAEMPEAGYQFLLRLLPVISQRLDNTRIHLLDVHGV